MTGEELIEALKSGRKVFGTMIVSNSPRWPAAVAGVGLDFVFIDTEHVALDRYGVSWMCQAYRALGLPPIVRIPEPDPYRAAMVLDGGAAGIIAPYVESPEQVRQLAGAVKFRPLKGRRLKARLDGTAELEPELEDYLRRRSRGSVLIVNIESTPAMDRLDEIVAVAGLDAVLIGPHDLSCSLGLPERYDHPRFDEAVRAIIATARSAGLGAGVHFSAGIEPEIAWAKAGMNLIVHSSDLNAFSQTLRAELATIRRRLGEAPAAGEGESVDI